MPGQARGCPEPGAFSEKQVSTADGRCYAVRIMPYRTMHDVIAGLIVAFANITLAQELERALREEIVQLRLRFGGGSS